MGMWIGSWKDNDSGDSVVDMEQVLAVVKEEVSDAIIVDARSSGRLYGKEPEPRLDACLELWTFHFNHCWTRMI